MPLFDKVDNSLLEKITIVIPTYKRYLYLFRLLKFYESYDLPLRILILDSTPEQTLNYELSKMLSNPNITWKRYDPKIFYVDKIAQGSELINTEYSFLCSDDDFIIPTAINQCVFFLKNNPDYSSVHGFYFHHTNSERANNQQFTLGPLYHMGHSVIEETASERINAYLSGQSVYHPLFAIHKAKIFRYIWSESAKYVSDWGLAEVFPNCLSFVYGKMKVLPIFYASREPNDYCEFDVERFKEMYTKEKIGKAIEGVGKHLAKVDGLSIGEAESIVKMEFDKFLKIFNIKMKRQNAKQINNIKDSLFIKLRQKVRLRSRIRVLFFQGCHHSIYTDYLSDYKQVRSSVMSAGLTFDDLNECRKDTSEFGT